MKLLEFHAIITKNHDNLIIPLHNHENHEIPRTPSQNNKNHETIIIRRQNHENHEIPKVPY